MHQWAAHFIKISSNSDEKLLDRQRRLADTLRRVLFPDTP